MDTIRVDEGGNKKVTDFEQILLLHCWWSTEDSEG
jgi:hypothetical protein